VADVGARYYTYVWTMLLGMEACAEAGLRFVVCDRPNPIGGAVEGAPQDAEYLSFVGLHPIPVRHGMTAGELARLLATERRIGVDLHVVPATGWSRETPFAETGLPWVSPSPNIPSPATSSIRDVCEGTNLSEGEGPRALRALRRLSSAVSFGGPERARLTGGAFLPTFRPMFDKHAGDTCGGALLEVGRRRAYRSSGL
jgi:uncharacterized protein YbbC (DUF1343 family)